MKDYFSHDYYSRNDPKIVRLFMKHGLAGIGAFWCIVEMLYEEHGYLMQSECERIAFELRAEESLIHHIIFDSDLFQNDGEKFWSNTALERIKKRLEISEKARQSAENRWNKQNGDRNVMRTHSDSNANNLVLFPFVSFWDMYDKKVGDKTKLKAKWDKLPESDKKKIMEYLPLYVKSTPDKTYRKNPETFLNNHSWNDEITSAGEKTNVNLGIGESIINGKRMFFGKEIPMTARPRPSTQHTWGESRKDWYIQ